MEDENTVAPKKKRLNKRLCPKDYLRVTNILKKVFDLDISTLGKFASAPLYDPPVHR